MTNGLLDAVGRGSEVIGLPNALSVVDVDPSRVGQSEGETMRNLVLGVALLAVAFAVGFTGAPGKAVATAAGWLEDRGSIELRGPVGDAVREAL